MLTIRAAIPLLQSLLGRVVLFLVLACSCLAPNSMAYIPSNCRGPDGADLCEYEVNLNETTYGRGPSHRDACEDYARRSPSVANRPGLHWVYRDDTYSCLFQWDGSDTVFGNGDIFRSPKPEITLRGPDETTALPVGPVLTLVAKVMRGSAPVAGRSVSVSGAGPSALSGVTDANGEFAFTYLPPVRKATTELVTANCEFCVLPAVKPIKVHNCEVCGPTKGNPIQPGNGEKEQSELDWADAGPHPLHLQRHYRSFGSTAASEFGGWTSVWAAKISLGATTATLQFGDGAKKVFFRESSTGAWIKADGATLVAKSDGTILYTSLDGQEWSFDGFGRLSSIKATNGWTYQMAFNNGGQLAWVSNAFGRKLLFTYSGTRVSGVTTPDGQLIGYGYDLDGRLVTVTYPDQSIRRYHYEQAGFPMALTGITDERDIRLSTYTYDAQGRVATTTHAGGANKYVVTYSEYAGPRLLSLGSVINPAAFKVSATILNPLEQEENYSWTGSGGKAVLTGNQQVSDSIPWATRTLVVGSSLPQTETDRRGVVTTYEWNTERQLVLKETRAAGATEQQVTGIQWHATLPLPETVTQVGRTTAYTYDAKGNKLTEKVTDTTVSDGQSRQWSWTYSAQNLVETMTSPSGGVWHFGYDALGNRTSMQDPMGRTTSFTHDGAGRVLTRTDPGGLQTVYTYTARGLLKNVAAAGETTVYTYTATGQLKTVELPNGQTLTYTYNDAQRLTEIADSRGATVTYSLDAAGNRTREEVKDANGTLALLIARAIDPLSNRVKEIQGGNGANTSLEYDANGDLVTQTDPLNHSIRTSLDFLRRTTSTEFPSGTGSAGTPTVKLEWNQLDQLTRVTDPNGVPTSYVNNAFGDVIAENSPDTGRFDYGYDPAGNLKVIKDSLGNNAVITRDALGRPTKVAYSADHSVDYEYDAAGAVNKIVDPSGSSSYSRDALGRVTTKSLKVNDNPNNPSQFAVQYSYANGELAGITYPSGIQVTYQRSAGRVTGIDVKVGSQTTAFATGITYTALGQPKSWNWFSGDTASRSFDADGRMTASEIGSYTYDAAGRVKTLTHPLWAQKKVTNADGTSTYVNYFLPQAWSAEYDSRNRLTRMARAGASASYTYDANSNRLSAVEIAENDANHDGSLAPGESLQQTTQVSTIKANTNQLVGFTQTVVVRTQAGATTTQVITPVTYTLDANRALTSDGLRTFTYDAARRLAKVRLFKDGEAAIVSYLHNGLGQRVFKSEVTAEQMLPNETTLGQSFVDWLKSNFGWLFQEAQANTSVGTAFVYDEEGNLLGQYDNGGASSTGRMEYIWLPTDNGPVLIGAVRSNSLFAVHTDHLGTPRLITKSDNTPVWQLPYSAFGGTGGKGPSGLLKASTDWGSAVAQTDVNFLGFSAPSITFNLRFPGQYFDEESNLSYNYFRTYDQRTGRYTQADPIGLGGGLNRYGYAHQNPLLFTDPEGLRSPGPAAPGTYYSRGTVPRPIPYSTTPRNAAYEAAANMTSTPNPSYPGDPLDLPCVEWVCPMKDGACTPGDFKRYDAFIPAARSTADAPAGCKCVSAGRDPAYQNFFDPKIDPYTNLNEVRDNWKSGRRFLKMMSR